MMAMLSRRDRVPWPCVLALALALGPLSTAAAAPRSPDQVKQEQAWLASVGADLRAAAKARKAGGASASLLRFEHARFVYDPTSVAHVIVSNEVAGVTVHVSSGWIALAEDAALADQVAESTGNPACSRAYLKNIGKAIRRNLDYERGGDAAPQAVDRFRSYVEDGDDAECHWLALAPWRDTWRPQGLEVSQRMEAGLTWWVVLDLLCMPGNFDARRCPLDGVEDHEAQAVLDQLGIASGLLTPIRELRVTAFIDTKSAHALRRFEPLPLVQAP